MQFVLTEACAAAKSKALVIWAPTVVMRHLQCRRPNQIFGCASSDAISHIVTVVLAGRAGYLGQEGKSLRGCRWGGKEGKRGEEGRGERDPACVRSSSQAFHPLITSTMFGQEPSMHNIRAKEQYAG